MPTFTATEPELIEPEKPKHPDPVWSNLFVRLNLATADLRRKVEDMGPQTDPDSLARHIITVMEQENPNMEEVNLCLLILKEKMTTLVSRKLWDELWAKFVGDIRTENDYRCRLLELIATDEDAE